jgi:hypothetical protein
LQTAGSLQRMETSRGQSNVSGLREESKVIDDVLFDLLLAFVVGAVLIAALLQKE